MMNDESKTLCAGRNERSVHHSSLITHHFLLRFALCLALICLVGLGAGCRRPAILPAAPRVVRIESLLPLHPAWAQTQALNRIAAGLAPANPALAANVAPLPPPFPFMQTTPQNLANERKKRIRDDADQYLTQLAAFLIADNAQRLARETRARQRQADAQYRRELETKVTELTAAAAKKRADLNRQINRLGYTAVAYESQGRIFIGQSQRDAKDNLKRVNQQIDELTAQRDAIPADFRSAAVAQLQARRAALNRGVRDFETARATELAAELQDQLASRGQQLDNASSAITTFGETLPATPKPAAIPVPPPPDFRAVNQAAQAQITAALARQKSATDAQRERLTAVIRADTEQAVAQIAARENWKLVPAGTLGARDATDDAAKALREQWKTAPSQ